MSSQVKRMSALAANEREAALAKVRAEQARHGQLRQLLDEIDAETGTLVAAIKKLERDRRNRSRPGSRPASRPGSKPGSSSGGSARGQGFIFRQNRSKNWNLRNTTSV